jgi:protein TonB
MNLTKASNGDVAASYAIHSRRAPPGELPRGGIVDHMPLHPVVTLVLWFMCLAVGVAGLVLSYPRIGPAAKQPEPPVQILNVKVTEDPGLPAPPDSGPPPPTPEVQPLVAPPPPADLVVAPAPPLVAVAVPNPAIPFALPVEQPSRIVDAKQAVPPARPTTPMSPQVTIPARSTGPPTGVPQRLTFGEGEGAQPAPLYPREAVMARQEGTVIVRFTVGADGSVQKAEASKPSSSAMLNQAAVRAVRETWRFRAGPVRLYEVAIEFELRQH